MKDVRIRITMGIMFVFTVACAAWAQFPKIPKISKKLPGQSDSKAQEQKSKGPVPEITSVSPDSAPPGGAGELVLTGKNFAEGMGVRFSCKDSASPHIDSLKVESAGRAVAHVAFPDNLEDGPCDIYVDYVMGNNNEILPSREGTPEVAQMRSATFTASSSSTTLPVGLGEFGLVPEAELKDLEKVGKSSVDMEQMAKDIQSGKVNPMDPDFIKKMQEASMAMSKMAQQAGTSAQKRVKGYLSLKGTSLSFTQEGKTVFTEPVSKVKEVAEVKDPMGRSGKIFKIAFADGKTYGFESDQSGSGVTERIKKRLGK